MPDWRSSCPLTTDDAIDRYFLEHRAKLLDVAAFLDRVARTTPDGSLPDDFRLDALRTAIRLLDDGEPDRAKRVLEVFSDPSDTPIDVAGGKGASGAYPGTGSGGDA